MAERHSIDHPPGSQGLSSAFYDYHRRHGGIWYIKNEHGQFIDGSADFLATFMGEGISFNQSHPLDDMSVFGYFNDNIKKVEGIVRGEKERRVIIVSVFAQEKQEPFIFTINSFMSGVYVKIDSLYFMGFERKIIKALCGSDDSQIHINVQHHRFDNINPFLDLDPDDWLVAWLMVIGFSQREIAGLLSLNLKAIEKRASSVYTTLILRDHDAFMAMSAIHQWSRFIPPRISTSPILFELRLM